ncbi:MAG: hypothetical protein LBC60_06785 [Spirochaetaceae bacterium]|jgi:hypothetical protein|nr:hypothetical protein [Spirochaetaceae bacterium]
MKKTNVMLIIVAFLLIAGTNVGAGGRRQAAAAAPSVVLESEPEFVALPLPKTTFTISMRRELPDAELNRIQFFLSNGITLTQEAARMNIKVDSTGKIVTTDGLDYNQIRIPAETPGRLGVNNDYSSEYGILAVCFEDNNMNNNVIYFQPNPEKDRYELIFFSRDGTKLVKYGDLDYEVSYLREIPYLLVINEQQKDDRMNTRTVTGRHL